MIVSVTFDIIRPIWSTMLWPGRLDIETHSAMIYKSDIYDAGNFALPVWFDAMVIDNKIVGVNSGHLCTDGSARSRGLWVDQAHRHRGYGTQLLINTQNTARVHGATYIWSYPRKESARSYELSGFVLTSDWEISDTSKANAYCYLALT